MKKNGVSRSEVQASVVAEMNEVAADLLSTGRLSGNQWIQGILFYAESYSRKIGGLLMRKTLRRTRG